MPASAQPEPADAQELLAAGSRRNFVSNGLVVATPIDTKLPMASLADLHPATVAKVALGRPASMPAGRTILARCGFAKP